MIIRVVRKSTWNDYTWVRVQLLINLMAVAHSSQAMFEAQGWTGFREEPFPIHLSSLFQEMVELNGPVLLLLQLTRVFLEFRHVNRRICKFMCYATLYASVEH